MIRVNNKKKNIKENLIFKTKEWNDDRNKWESKEKDYINRNKELNEKCMKLEKSLELLATQHNNTQSGLEVQSQKYAEDYAMLENKIVRIQGELTTLRIENEKYKDQLTKMNKYKTKYNQFKVDLELKNRDIQELKEQLAILKINYTNTKEELELTKAELLLPKRTHKDNTNTFKEMQELQSKIRSIRTARK